ncbi:MAG: hypothetical protein QHH17_01770 [Candidatus Bathyarchaeota archaeon]|jgi:hypothetical protein|nr:hypothetical protein [Candidatus Bathyarchaeota archaeon]
MVSGVTIGTTTSTSATYYPYQRKSFYANGRFWAFYFDGTNIVYQTSTDSENWTSPATVRAASNGYFSIWFDGTYFHYAYANASQIYYRRGLPNSDGSITWSASEQTVSTSYNVAYYCFVSVDSDGYVWIGYIDKFGVAYYPYIIKSGNNDGTWGSTPNGFPYRLSSTSGSTWRVTVVPLTNLKMLVVYTKQNFPLNVVSWNGSSWNTELTTTSYAIFGTRFSVVTEGDDAHIVWLKATGYDILHVKYTYSTNSLSSEHTVIAGASIVSAPVICRNPTTNYLYCLWSTDTDNKPSGATAHHIYYQTSSDGGSSWTSYTDWLDESSETLYINDDITSFYNAYSSFIGLMYFTLTSSPYNVKFAILTLGGQVYEISVEAIVKASALAVPWVECGELYENYTTDDNSDLSVFGNVWGAQTFTVGSEPHTVKAIVLKLSKAGNPGTFIVGIRAVGADGKPTGDDLTSGSIDGNTLPTSPEWIQIMVAEYTLNANTTYAIVVRAPNGSDQNWVKWRYADPGYYEGGIYMYSLDGGNTWLTAPNCDYLFQVWGYAISGQVHEIYVDAVSQSVATLTTETTYNIAKDAAVAGQSLHVQETIFNLLQDAIAKALAGLGIETTFNIPKDAVVNVLADVLVEVVTGIIEIFKDAITTAQALCQTETVFNVSLETVAQALTQKLFELGIAKDAVVKASTSSAYEVTFTLPLDALVKADALSLLESTFNVSKEATIKVLAEISIVKSAEVKITRLYLVMGDLAIQIQGC